MSFLYTIYSGKSLYIHIVEILSLLFIIVYILIWDIYKTKTKNAWTCVTQEELLYPQLS